MKMKKVFCLLFVLAFSVLSGCSTADDAGAKSTSVTFKVTEDKEFGGVNIDTGFACALLEALAGASYDEMKSDYMKTYENYYGITEQKTPDKYNAVVSVYFDDFVSYLHGTENHDTLVSADYSEDAERYLSDSGMTSGEINSLRKMITKASSES